MTYKDGPLSFTVKAKSLILIYFAFAPVLYANAEFVLVYDTLYCVVIYRGGGGGWQLCVPNPCVVELFASIFHSR